MTRDVRVTVAIEGDEASITALANRIHTAIDNAVKKGLKSGLSASAFKTIADGLTGIEAKADSVADSMSNLEKKLANIGASSTKTSGLSRLDEQLQNINKRMLEGKLSTAGYATAISKVTDAYAKSERANKTSAAETKRNIDLMRQAEKEAKQVAEAMILLAKANETTDGTVKKLTEAEAAQAVSIAAKRKALEATITEYNKAVASQKEMGDETVATSTKIAMLQTAMAELANEIAADEQKIENAIRQSSDAIKQKIALEKQLRQEGLQSAETLLKLARANQELANGTAEVSEEQVRLVQQIKEQNQALKEASIQYSKAKYEQAQLGDETLETAQKLERMEQQIAQYTNAVALSEKKLQAELKERIADIERLENAQKQQVAEELAATKKLERNARDLAHEMERLAIARERADNSSQLHRINIAQEAQQHLANKSEIKKLTLAYVELSASLSKADADHDQIRQSMRATEAQIERLSKAIAEYENRMNKSASGQGGLNQMLGRFSASFFRMQAIILAFAQLGQVIQFTVTQLLEGAAVLQGRESFFTIAGDGADKLLADVRRASSGLLAEEEILKTGTALIAGTTGELREALAGSADEIITIARAAIKVNPAVSERYGGLEGVTARLVEGIRKQEVELFDEFRIIVRLGEAVKQYAEENDKSVESLTLVERQQAFLNSVLSEGGVLIRQLNGDLSSQADAYTLLGTKLTDLKTKYQALFAEGVLPFVEAAGGKTGQDMTDLVNIGITSSLGRDVDVRRLLSDYEVRMQEVTKSLDVTFGERAASTFNPAAKYRIFLKDLENLTSDFGESVGLLMDEVAKQSDGDLEKFVELLSEIGPGTETNVGQNFSLELAGRLALLSNNANEFADAMDRLGVPSGVYERLGSGTANLAEDFQRLGISASQQIVLLDKLEELRVARINSGDMEFGNNAEQYNADISAAIFDVIKNYPIAIAEASSFDVVANRVNKTLEQQNAVLAKSAEIFGEQYAKSVASATEEMLKNKEGVDEWITSLFKTAEAQGASGQQLLALAENVGVFSDAELKAISNTAMFEAELAKLLAEAAVLNPTFAGVGEQVLLLAERWDIAARAVAYFSKEQRGAFLQGFLAQAPDATLNPLRGFAGGLSRPSIGGSGGGGGAVEKEVDEMATQFASLLESIAKEGIGEFRESLLSTEDGLSGLEKKLYSLAAAGGASVSQMRALATALERGEDAAEAFRVLAAERGIEVIVEQFLSGSITAEQAAGGVKLLNEQLAAGQDIDLSSLGIDLTTIAGAVKEVNAATGGGGGEPVVKNWLDDLIAASEAAGATAETIAEIARRAGYTEEQIAEAFRNALLTDAVERISAVTEEIGGQAAASLLEGFKKDLEGETKIGAMQALADLLNEELGAFEQDGAGPLEPWRRSLLEYAVEAGVASEEIIKLAKAQETYNEEAITTALRAEAMRIQVETLVGKLKDGASAEFVLAEQEKFMSFLDSLGTVEELSKFVDTLTKGGLGQGLMFDQPAKQSLQTIGKEIEKLFSKENQLEMELDTDPIVEAIEKVGTNGGDGYNLQYRIDPDQLRALVQSALDTPFVVELDFSNSIGKMVESIQNNLPVPPTPRPTASGGERGIRREGGLQVGPSHEQGGIPVEVEGNEYIIPKRMMSPKLYNVLESARMQSKAGQSVGDLPDSVFGALGTPTSLAPIVSANTFNQMVPVPSVSNSSSSTSIVSNANRTTVINNFYGSGRDSQLSARPTMAELNGQ